MFTTALEYFMASHWNNVFCAITDKTWKAAADTTTATTARENYFVAAAALCLRKDVNATEKLRYIWQLRYINFLIYFDDRTFAALNFRGWQSTGNINSAWKRMGKRWNRNLHLYTSRCGASRCVGASERDSPRAPETVAHQIYFWS